MPDRYSDPDPSSVDEQRQSTGSDFDPTRISDRARAAIEADEENP
ncbi:hypothetical protein [Nocardia farcinica]|nr:hypothetical protein [Nocardia farcinica]